jgi:DNA-binding transcriptional regulator YiaG
VADSLESYREALTLTQESGNIDQTAASWMLAAGEAITARVGVPLNSVSVESFSSPTDAADAVELVSLEAGGLWEKLVQAIKDMIAKARNALKGLWVKLTDGGAKLSKRGEALQKKARDTKGSAEEKTFEASFIDKVHVGGKAPSANALVASVKDMDSLAKTIFEGSEAAVKKNADEVKDLLTKAGEGKDFDASDFVKMLFETGSKLGLKNNGPAHLSVGDGVVVSSDELLGGKVVFVSAAAAGTDIGKAVNSFSAGVGSAAEKDDVDAKGDVAVLGTSECGDIGAAVKLAGERMSGFNKNFQARDKMKDAINKELDKIEKKMSKDEKDTTPEQKQASKDAITAVRAAVKSLDNPVSDYARYLVTTLATVVSWGERSLSMYKES